MHDPRSGRWSGGVVFVTMLAALALWISPVSADEITELKEQVQSLTVELAKLEKKDGDLQSAIEDIKLAQFWLNEAQAQLVEKEEDVAKQYIRRVEVSLLMIDAVIETAKVEKTAFDRESAAIAMEKEAFDAKAELEKAELLEKKLMTEIEAGSGAKDGEKKEGTP